MPTRDSAAPVPDVPADGGPDLAGLSYERARDDLMAVVQQLESGTATLAQSIELWQRGEKLAGHCQQLLDAARSTVAGAGQAAGRLAGDEAAD